MRTHLVGNETNPSEIYFTTKLGMLVKIFSFILKGKSSDAQKCINTLCNIEHPDEILSQTTSRGKFIFKRFQLLNKHYEELLATALKQKKKDKLLVFTYTDNRMSFTGDLANEIIFKNPKMNPNLNPN